MTGIIGIVLAVLTPQGGGCQPLRSLQPGSSPVISSSSATPATTTTPAITTEPPASTPSIAPPAVPSSADPHRSNAPQPPPSGGSGAITTRPLAPPEPPSPSYTAQPVRLDAKSWCEYGALDIETRAVEYHEVADGHSPGIDLIYDGCGDGATLTTKRTSGQALGRSSPSTTSAEQCRQDAQSQNTEAIQGVPAGQVLCMVTGEGGVARIVVTKLVQPYTEDGAPSLELEITYWATL